MFLQQEREPGSSVSIVSGYGLDDRVIEVRSPAGAKDFSSSLCVQTGSEAHPASCTMGTGGPFPGGKARSGRDADHWPLSSAEVVREWVGAIPPLPPRASMACSGTDLLLQRQQSALETSLFVSMSRPALGPAHSPIRHSSPVIKRPKREAEQSPPSSTEIRNAWRYTSTSQRIFTAWCVIRHRGIFAFTVYELV
jgi:hypothetical protein